MTYQRRDIQKTKDTDEVRLNNSHISGEMYKYLCARADKKNQGWSSYASFLIEELLKEFAKKNPIPNDLISDNWKNQAEVTGKTLKTK